jgi:UDP-GlcNAc:undecaprenyl-phosphate GlcNAc-1-phosphate transferase
MEPVLFILVLVQSFILTMLLTPVAKRAAHWFDFLDHPNQRKVHVEPTPLLGGAAIYFSFVLTILGNILALRLLAFLGDPGGGYFQQMIAHAAAYLPGIAKRGWDLAGLLSGGTLIFLVGLYDDRYTIQPKVKLVGQIIAAFLFFLFFYLVGHREFFFIRNAWLVAGLLMLWIVGITNSINLMDNMDGLCAGVSSIALVFFSLVTYITGGQTFMVLAMLTLLGALLGFLWHNFNPARIFMGDAGSMFVGFTIASLVVFSTFYNAESRTILALAMPPIILAVPIFDTLTVIGIRIKRGLPIYQADKNHFSHRLVQLGLSHRNAVLLIYLVTICTGIGALLLNEVSFAGGVIILIQVAIILSIVLLLERAGRHRNDVPQG